MQYIGNGQGWRRNILASVCLLNVHGDMKYASKKSFIFRELTRRNISFC